MKDLGLVKKSTWTTIRDLHLQKNLPLDYIEYPTYYQVFVVWNTTKFFVNLFKPRFKEIIGRSSTNDDDYNDFITNFKSKIDANPPDSNPVNIAGIAKSGKKLAVHESSRPDNLEKDYTTCWTGSGDDVVNHIMWGGDPAILVLDPGVPSVVHDMKFDPVFGEVWIHEGYGMWENAGVGDYFSVYVMAPGVQLQTVSNLDLVLDGNRVRYSPNGPGTGTHGFASTPAPVYNYDGTGYWDIVDGNLVPNLNGTGKYDIYTVDKKAATFLNKIPVVGTTYSYTRLQSADSDLLVYPYFLRIEAVNVSNSSWKIWFFATIYRERTV